MDVIGQLFGWLPAGIQATLVWLTKVTGSAGLGIILLTLIIRGALFPLTKKQTQNMVAMRELQPKLKALQEKYKNKPEEYQKRLLELYKQEGVNPLGGCLPLLIQLPFLYALFYVLNTYGFEGADPNFLIWNLTERDPYYILPILSAVTTYLQSLLTVTDPSQRAILYIMPIFIGWISTQFAAGLVLYWVTSNIFSIGQQYLLSKGTPSAKGGASAK